jgi:hypothetical protein
VDEHRDRHLRDLAAQVGHDLRPPQRAELPDGEHGAVAGRAPPRRAVPPRLTGGRGQVKEGLFSAAHGDAHDRLPRSRLYPLT